jgi:hypothetical protein
MSFLRTRLRALREPFGKAGLTVGVIALVMALVGGAYAAGGLTKSQEKQVTKIAKKYAGKPGAAGPQGSPGAAGAAGKDGSNGSNGTNGTNGTSAEAASFSGSKGTCTEGQGGIEVKSAKPVTYVCNGQTGFTETLPSGKTETGAWLGESGTAKLIRFSISFPIPLEAALETAQTHFVTAEQVANSTIPTGCAGSPTKPEAAPGNLCLFEGSVGGFTEGIGFATRADTNEGGAAPTGAVVVHQTPAENTVYNGTWAVTAP